MKRFPKPAALRMSLWVFLSLTPVLFKSCSSHVPAHSRTPVNQSEQSYIGLSEAEALDKASAFGLRARVVSRDGKSSKVTKDHCPERLNFIISGGKVARVQKG